MGSNKGVDLISVIDQDETVETAGILDAGILQVADEVKKIL